MSVAWFIDGEYAKKCWNSVCWDHKLDWIRFREEVEDDAGQPVDVGYYFSADDDPPKAKQDGFHRFLGRAFPNGPGLRVELGSLQRRLLEWRPGEPVLHPTSGEQYELKSQKEVDVLLAFNLVRSHAKLGWKKLYLVAGDRDFFEVVRHLVENEGVQLTIFGTERGTSGYPTISGKFGSFGRHIYFENLVEGLKGPLREHTNA